MLTGGTVAKTQTVPNLRGLRRNTENVSPQKVDENPP
jgi:hypothetical protein